EVRDRKKIDSDMEVRVKNSLGLVNDISSQMDLLMIKSNETMEVINQIFPTNAEEVNIDKKFTARELEVTLGAHFNSTLSVRSDAVFQAKVSANNFAGASIALTDGVTAKTVTVTEGVT